MRFVVAGATGQLGRALVELLGERAVWAGGRDALDVGDPLAVSRIVAGTRPDVIVNAAAYNAVDRAETETAEALRINAAGPTHLARAALATGALLVHISTDYVFDGSCTRPYVEEDRPVPPNAYGASKLAGEMAVAASGGPHLIVRTSGLFGRGGSRAKGGSFVERIVAAARDGRPLRVVADQVFSPTYAPDLARAILALVERRARGLFHVTNAGECSWHVLAEAAVRAAGLSARIEPIHAAELRAPARRPAYSVLSNRRYVALGLPPLRPWGEALVELFA